MKKTLKYLSICLLFLSAFRVHGAIRVESGKLHEVVAADSTLQTLSLEGTLNAEDFKFLADNFPGLQELDIKAVTIEAATLRKPLFGSATHHVANEIPTTAFLGTSLRKISLPASLTSIADGAFAGMKFLDDISLPDGLSNIGEGAFHSCTALKSISIPATVEKIGTHTFANCTSLEKMAFLASADIPNYFCSGCSELSKIELSSTIKRIGEEAFAGTSIQIADLSECSSLQEIGDLAFADNKRLTLAKLPIQLSKIGNGAFFMNGNLRSINMPESIDTVANYLLAGCENLGDSLVIPSSVTHIGAYAFSDLTSMLFYDLPQSLKYVGEGAMRNNSALWQIRIRTNTVPIADSRAFEGIDRPTVFLAVNSDMVNAFRAADSWKEFNVVDAATSVASPTADIIVDAKFVDNILMVKSSVKINSLLLFDIEGRALCYTLPLSDTAEIDTSALSGRYFLLAGELENGSRFNLKLLRN